MSNDKHYCCWCGEDLEYEQGREVWISNIDGNYGHMYCVEKYDRKKGKEPQYNEPKRNKLISDIKSKIYGLENDLKVVDEEISISLISRALNKYKNQLIIAEEEKYYDDIMDRIKLKKLNQF